MQCRARGRRRVRSRQRVLLRPRLRVLLIRVLLLLLLLLLEHLFCGELRQPSRQRARQRGVLVVGMDLGVAAARVASVIFCRSSTSSRMPSLELR